MAVEDLVARHRKVWGEAYVNELVKKTSLVDISVSTMWRVLSLYEGHLVHSMGNAGKLRDVEATKNVRFITALFNYLGGESAVVTRKDTNAVRAILTLDWMYPFDRYNEICGVEHADVVRLFDAMIRTPSVNHIVGLVTQVIDDDDLDEDILEELRLVVDDVFTEGRERAYLLLNTEVGLTRLCVELSKRVVEDDCFYTDMTVDEAFGYVKWLLNHLNGGYFCNHCFARVTTGIHYNTIGTLYCPRCLSEKSHAFL